MSEEHKLEFWLRGPLPGMPPLLQPIAHALLQAREEVDKFMADFPDDDLWEKPAGLASVGFHLQHLSGVIDRLFTYARGEALSQEQLAALSLEGEKQPGITAFILISKFNRQVDDAIDQLLNTREESLMEIKGVGRKNIPSTTFGILVHAAEHTQRHLGQLLVTSRIIRHKNQLP
jgi:uncharacterized damage-inducible protein DinB